MTTTQAAALLASLTRPYNVSVFVTVPVTS